MMASSFKQRAFLTLSNLSSCQKRRAMLHHRVLHASVTYIDRPHINIQ